MSLLLTYIGNTIYIFTLRGSSPNWNFEGEGEGRGEIKRKNCLHSYIVISRKKCYLEEQKMIWNASFVHGIQ